MIELIREYENEPYWLPVTGEEHLHSKFFIRDMLDRADILVTEEKLEEATIVFLKMRQAHSYELNIKILGI